MTLLDAFHILPFSIFSYVLPVIAGESVDEHVQETGQTMHATPLIRTLHDVWGKHSAHLMPLSVQGKHRGTIAEATMKEAIPKELSSTL